MDTESQSHGGNTTVSFAEPPRRVASRSHGGDIDLELPNRSVAYRVHTSAQGGSTDTAIRTDPSSSPTIRAESSGEDVTIRYRP